jgi:hypothetical protein
MNLSLMAGLGSALSAGGQTLSDARKQYDEEDWKRKQLELARFAREQSQNQFDREMGLKRDEFGATREHQKFLEHEATDKSLGEDAGNWAGALEKSGVGMLTDPKDAYTKMKLTRPGSPMDVLGATGVGTAFSPTDAVSHAADPLANLGARAETERRKLPDSDTKSYAAIPGTEYLGGGGLTAIRTPFNPSGSDTADERKMRNMLNYHSQGSAEAEKAGQHAWAELQAQRTAIGKSYTDLNDTERQQWANAVREAQQRAVRPYHEMGKRMFGSDWVGYSTILPPDAPTINPAPAPTKAVVPGAGGKASGAGAAPTFPDVTKPAAAAPAFPDVTKPAASASPSFPSVVGPTPAPSVPDGTGEPAIPSDSGAPPTPLGALKSGMAGMGNAPSNALRASNVYNPIGRAPIVINGADEEKPFRGMTGANTGTLGEPRPFDVLMDSTLQTTGGGKGKPSLSVRNNNPGNLTWAHQPGARLGEGTTGGAPGKGAPFAAFESPVKGYLEVLRQIGLDSKRNLDVGGFVTKYAPPHENNTAQYIADLIHRFGVHPNTPISEIPTDKLAQFLIEHESHSKLIYPKK